MKKLIAILLLVGSLSACGINYEYKAKPVVSSTDTREVVTTDENKDTHKCFTITREKSDWRKAKDRGLGLYCKVEK